MAHVVSGKIRKAPFIKAGCGQDGQSTMYAIELSEMIKSHNSDEKFYTNYSALFFAKTQGANDLYSKVFAEGSFVVVACDKLKTDIQQSQDGRTFVKMQMENPKLDSFIAASEMTQQPQQQQQQGWGQPQQKQQPQRAPQQQQQPQQYQQQPQQQPAQQQYQPLPGDGFDQNGVCLSCGGTNPDCPNCSIPF